MRDQLRVAAVQFATTADLDENLATNLRMLDEAAATGADLIVFPEFANHISVYDSAEHCRAVAVDLDGEWLGSIAERVAQHGVHLAITVTVRGPADRVTITSVLIGPDGSILSTSDKNTLMGNERAHLSGAEAANDLASTEFGLIGSYACMDGVTFETPRGFAVRGARLLTNSLNSFARDEAALHIPVRAAENGVFVVAANKVGALLPESQVAQFSAALGVPAEALEGAGESQIVDPDGVVLARAPLTGEAVVVADIDLTAAHHQPLAARRPDIYDALAKPDNAIPRSDLPARVEVYAGTEPDPLDGGVELVVLPELTPPPRFIPPGVLVVTTMIDAGQHVGEVHSPDGIVLRQPMLHASDRFPSATDLGRDVLVHSTPFGDLALVVGDDHRYPEVFRLAAIAGAQVVAVCWQPQAQWEADLAIVERAAENRVCLVATAGPGPVEGTLVANPPVDSLWNPDRSADYDGNINTPEVRRAAHGAPGLRATIHPQRSLQREISRDTNLVDGRSWQASDVLTR